MAACVRVGLPENSYLVTAKIRHCLTASGCSLASPSREAFIQTPDIERMHEVVAEIGFPFGFRGWKNIPGDAWPFVPADYVR